MSSVSVSNLPYIRPFYNKPVTKTLILCPFYLSFPRYKARLGAVKTGSGGGGAVENSQEQVSFEADLLRKPAGSPSAGNGFVDYPADDGSEKKDGDGGAWVDWEDRILEDTVPLVGYVRMILHSGKYKSGDRLSPEHERIILERLLPYHPECEKKIGSGVEYITIGYHPNYESSRCMFIVHKDGKLVDFSYWKCIKGLIRKNYPLYAGTFILRHFSRRKPN